MPAEALTMIFIFLARILDVSIGTIRIILISRGYRYLAPLLGFFEVLIWLTAISTALQGLHNALSYIIYAGGFATGNYVGMLIEAKLSIGFQSIRIITSKKVSILPLTLVEEGFNITSVDGRSKDGPVSIIYSVVPKKHTEKILNIVKILEPNAFITVEDVKSHHDSYIGKKNFYDLFSRMIQKKK